VAAIVAASLQQSAFQPTAGCTTAAESIVGTAVVLAAAVVAAVAVHPAKAVVGDPLLAAQTAAALFQRAEAWRDLAASVVRIAAGGAVVERIQMLGKIRSLDVLDVVDVQTGRAAGARIDLGDEIAHLVHVGRLRGDHHDAVAVLK